MKGPHQQLEIQPPSPELRAERLSHGRPLLLTSSEVGLVSLVARQDKLHRSVQTLLRHKTWH